MVDDRRPRLVILKTGDKLPELADVPGDFEHWIAAGMGVKDEDIEVVAVHRGQALPARGAVAGVVITGSAAMVTDHSDWIEASAAWLRALVNAGVPVLGICFGHQLLAYAMGGDVDDNPNGIEVGTIKVGLQYAAQHDRLFSKLPRDLDLHASHRQSVLALPPDAVLLASSALDPHHAFRIGSCAWGVQFHPEFTGAITRSYIAFYQHRATGITRSGTLASNPRSVDTPFGTEVLCRFAQVVVEQSRVDRSLDACL